MKPISFFLLALFGISMASCGGLLQVSEEDEAPEIENSRPKLVIGIVVDQMRYDYLTRYWEDYSEDGFKRLMTGFVAHDHHFSYAPTYTGPGHASVYTGTTPSVHGIISNDWFNGLQDSSVYCTEDLTVKGVGTESAAGQMSPRRMLASTMCDELKLFSNGRSKTIGVSLKDRGAILPAGHSANGAYWFVGGEEGQWVTSTFYGDALPDWVKAFNLRNMGKEMLKEGWKRFKEEAVYDESLADNNPYEKAFVGGERPTFPYDLQALALQNGNFDILKATPHGNKLTVEFARAAI
ncbi:MAG: alkaline phosphatase family protein, partial [Flavobacteriales bacterium]|nr:alkaline phosphatase family protein [Flavobacteriales bacterium]